MTPDCRDEQGGNRCFCADRYVAGRGEPRRGRLEIDAFHALAGKAGAPGMTVTALDRSSSQDYAAQEARLRRELAAVYRLIAHFKMTDLIYNHISVRLPGHEHRFLPVSYT